MIHFIATAGYGNTHEVLVEDPDAPAVRLLDYDALFRGERPAGTCIFTDFDRLDANGLKRAAAIFREMSARSGKHRLLNDPSRVLLRFALLRKLYDAGLNPYNVYRLRQLLHVRRFPVFARGERGHDWPVSSLLEDRYRLRQFLAGLDENVDRDDLMICEYCAQPAAEGVFRKLSAYRIGDQMISGETVHDESWCVKYGKKGIASETLYEDELRLVCDNPHAERLERVFDLAGIDYGRADYGLVNGEIVVYEINTNPMLEALGTHPSATRQRSHRLIRDNYLTALAALDKAA